ncbi:unnamed protein product [Triticum turgidum subsp. durum]|uniref:Plasma membrane ATPase n=1 Tax=Triticum turgidum subsp. durum TaxID=4567 RepID=A0A9R1P7B1_TRITD|nr:unnamed protein product [Triticum turgidum subsp. durum]
MQFPSPSVLLGFMLIALIWKFDFAPFMVLIIAILNDGTIMTISKDRVKPSPLPDSWKLNEIFATGVVLGTYLALVTVVFFWLIHKTDFFTNKFGVESIRNTEFKEMSALYLQVSIVSQALIFVTRSRSWSFVERPGFLLVTAFLLAQLVATLIAVYANWDFARIKGIGWGWAGVIWLFSIVFYFPLDIFKFFIRFVLSGRAWDNLLRLLSPPKRTTAKGRGKHNGLPHREHSMAFKHRSRPPTHCSTTRAATVSSLRSLSKQREELRLQGLRELNTLKGHVESVVKLKGLDIDTINQNYTV